MAKKELDDLIYYYDSYEESTQDSRDLSQQCRDYYVGEQWTAKEKADIRSRGQEPIVFNLVVSRIDYLIGYQMNSQTAVKAYPRGYTNNPTVNSMNEAGANSATDSIRYVLDNAKWDDTESRIWENILIEGTGGCEVLARKTRDDDVEITIKRIPWHRQFYDPRSVELNFGDAKFLGNSTWMDLEDATDMFRGKDDILESSLNGISAQDSSSKTSRDRPTKGVWADGSGRRPRVKIVQMAYRTGFEDDHEWHMATFCRGGFLYEPELSPYVDEKGQTLCPFLFRSAKIDSENNRYSPCATYIYPQYEVNHRRSKSLFLLSFRQTMAERGAIQDVRRMKRELTKGDGHVEVEPGMQFQILPTNDMFAGQFELLQEAKAMIDATGANASLTGRDPRAQSGRALQTRQQGGIIELQPVFKGLLELKQRVYEAVYHRIRQFWTAEKWIRVTDDKENLKFVGLNRPTTVYELLTKQGEQLPPFEQLPPELQAIAGQQIVENNIQELDVDIILSDTQDVVSLQNEQFEQLAQMASAGVPIPPDVIIEASSLRNKQEIVDKMRGAYAKTPQEKQAAAQAQAQQQAIQQQAIQLELAQKAADVDKTKSETAKNLSAVEKSGVDAATGMAGLISDNNLPPDFTGLQ